MQDLKATDNNSHADSRRDSAIAAAVTFIAALLILLFLYWGEIGFSRADMAAASTPEIAEEEELFLEPELVDVGEPMPATEAQAAPEALGEPEKSEPTEVRIPEVQGKSEERTPPKEKLVTQKDPSPVTSREPSSKQTKKVSDPTANAFSPHNGKPNGRNGSAGAGGNSTGVTGTANGWVFKGCPKPSVTLSNKVTVTVKITVNEKGYVTNAKASGATPEINHACEQVVYKAHWEPTDPKNRRKASGTITFTIRPN